ncbi:ribosome recycling factor [Lacticaseibacillus sharpeae]|uniref:Ribosome-recycling factor n=1 Tax=Lacticaseibacillus sharpeae JCM 1186 = DSM 20505 TaxID=1291052 RepID=A0A0R1ZL26_9LACO|nr:ribosome recycling factor [Lacticaseibacillus sharpeae]KRM55696.1 ribosome recycling factor [Lacticaseibacillus sharpeae JCM 1186 = DSM 20505]
MANVAIEHAQDTMKKTEAALERNLATIRAGRANAGLLSHISVEYYGAPTPLPQMAAITIPEPRVLQVNPYDKSSLKDIENALLVSDLGINPMNDGTVIRLVVPQLTTESRRDLTKQVGKHAEEAKIAVRNIRRDAIDDIKKQQKAGDINEDDQHRLEKEAQKVTDAATKRIDEIAAAKEKDIMEG